MGRLAKVTAPTATMVQKVSVFVMDFWLVVCAVPVIDFLLVFFFPVRYLPEVWFFIFLIFFGTR